MELNIFTDASITKTIYGETIGCAGAICMENNNLLRYEIFRDCTNNISEISAVKLGVLLALENRDLYDKVNIWSDSQWSIFGLTKWIKSWVNNAVNYRLINSSGEAVKNQEIFLSIIKLIVDNNLPVNFYHIKGHVAENNIKSIDHATSVFYKSNGIRISRERIYYAVKMNNLVDNTTRKLLDTWKDVEPVKLNRGIVNFILSKEDMIRYYNLVSLGGVKLCQMKD